MLLENKSVLTVLQDIVGDVQELFRAETRLAIAETQEQLAKKAKAGRLLVAGIVVGIFAVGMLLLAIVCALARVMAPWLAAFLLGSALLAVAGVTIWHGREQMKHLHRPTEAASRVKRARNYSTRNYSN